MDKENTPPSCSSCFTYLLILLGIIFAIGAALLLSQFDTLQQRTLLPQATIPVIDFEATLAAGDLPVTVLPGEVSQSALPTTASFSITKEPDQLTIDDTPEPSSQVDITGCSTIPDGWLPYKVGENDTLRSLAIIVQVDEDSLASTNCLIQPQITAGEIIYLPIPVETTTEGIHPLQRNEP
jgi:hypothetical protein